jgi:hypothetical protein
MLIRLDDPVLVEDLCAHFKRSGFTVERVGGGMIEVGRPDVPVPEQAGREIALHARVWEAMHPDARVELQ